MKQNSCAIASLKLAWLLLLLGGVTAVGVEMRCLLGGVTAVGLEMLAWRCDRCRTLDIFGICIDVNVFLAVRLFKEKILFVITGSAFAFTLVHRTSLYRLLHTV